MPHAPPPPSASSRSSRTTAPHAALHHHARATADHPGPSASQSSSTSASSRTPSLDRDGRDTRDARDTCHARHAAPTTLHPSVPDIVADSSSDDESFCDVDPASTTAVQLGSSGGGTASSPFAIPQIMRIPSSRGGSDVELIFDRDTASTVASTMQRSNVLPALTIESASTVSLTLPHAMTRSAPGVGPTTSAPREPAAHAHAPTRGAVPAADVSQTVSSSVSSLPTMSNFNSLSDSRDSASHHPTVHSIKMLNSSGMASEYTTMPLAPRDSTAPLSTPSIAQTTLDTSARRFTASADGSLPTPLLRRASRSAPGPAGLTTTRSDSPTSSPSTTKPRGSAAPSPVPSMARRPGGGSPQDTMHTAPRNPPDAMSSLSSPRPAMPKSATVDQHMSAAGLTVPMPAQLLLPGNVSSAIRHITIARSLARQRTLGHNGTMGSSADLEAGRIAGVPDAPSLHMTSAGESVSIDRPVSPTGDDDDENDDEEEDGGDEGAGGVHGMSKSAMSVPVPNAQAATLGRRRIPDPGEVVLSPGPAEGPETLGTEPRFPLLVYFRGAAATILERPDATWWRIFDRISWTMDMYYLIVVPFTFAFCCDYGRDFIYSFFFLDSLCIVRIALNVVRPYIDQYGQLLFDPKSKREHYFFHRSGWLDVIGAIPFDYIPICIALADGSLDDMECTNPHFVYPDGHVYTGTPDPHLGSKYQARFLYRPGDVPALLFWFSLLRLLRLVGTTGTVRWALQANFPMVSSPISRLIKNLLLSVYISHIDTCGFWFMETRTNDHGRWITENHLDLDEHGSLPVVWWRYLVTFFISQRALFFIHRHTVVPDEMLYQCMEALFAACLYGSILGNLSQIVRSFDTQATVDKAEKHRKIQRQFLAQYMINKHFPPTLQRRVLQQEEFEWVHKRGVNTELLLGEALPKSLRLEVCVHLYYALISEVPLFSETDDLFKVALCERISLITAPKGFYACKAGDAGNEMYFIRRGGVDVLNRDETKVLTKLGVSAYFGEVALFQECRRTATVKTNTDTELCVLKKADFDDILAASPAMVAVFRKAVAEREERDVKRKEEEAAVAAAAAAAAAAKAAVVPDAAFSTTALPGPLGRRTTSTVVSQAAPHLFSALGSKLAGIARSSKGGLDESGGTVGPRAPAASATAGPAMGGAAVKREGGGGAVTAARPAPAGGGNLGERSETAAMAHRRLSASGGSGTTGSAGSGGRARSPLGGPSLSMASNSDGLAEEEGT